MIGNVKYYVSCGKCQIVPMKLNYTIKISCTIQFLTNITHGTSKIFLPFLVNLKPISAYTMHTTITSYVETICIIL